MAGLAGEYTFCIEQGGTFDELHDFRFTDTGRPAWDFDTAVEHRAFVRPVVADEDLEEDGDIALAALEMTLANGRIVYEPTVVPATAVSGVYTAGTSILDVAGADFFGAGVLRGEIITIAGGPFAGTYYVRVDPTAALPDRIDLEDLAGVQVSWASTEVAAGTVAATNTARVRFLVDSVTTEALTIQEGVWDYEVDFGGGPPPLVVIIYKGPFVNEKAATKPGGAPP